MATADNAAEQDYQRHLQMWRGFARFMRWAVIHIVIVLALLAYFLL